MENKNLEPKIYIPNSKIGLHYVYIYDKITQKVIQKYYKGINTDPDPLERLYAAQDLQEALRLKLKSGWIPNVGKSLITPISIKEALEEAIKRLEGKVSKNTFDAYSGTTRFFIQAIEQLKFSKLPTDKFSRAYAKKCIDWIVKNREWSNSAYNKNLGYIRSVFAEIIESEQAEINPFRDIKNLKVDKKPANIPPTDEEMKLICDTLKANNYGFYIFYMLIYHCGLRPEECRVLKIENIDFERKLLLLESFNTKTKQYREVPMLGNIYDLLINYKNLDKNLYIFGTWVNNGGRHSHKNWFFPNEFPIKDDTLQIPVILTT